jgi:hypothetical protein
MQYRDQRFLAGGCVVSINSLRHYLHMQKILLLLPASLWALRAEACPWCRPRVQAGIYTPAYATNALLVLLPVAVLLALGLGVYFWDRLRPARAASHVGRC